MTDQSAEMAEAIRQHCLSHNTPSWAALTGCGVAIYQICSIMAALREQDPSETLADFISALEEGFGDYLLSNKPSLEALRRAAKALR